MRIQIASDLHLEHLEHRFADWLPIQPGDSDVLVLAGDIHAHARAIDRFRDWPTPVLYVLGNHEYYRSQMGPMLAQVRAAALGSSIKVLDCDALVLDGVRFLGATLWTSFEVGRVDGEPSMDAIASHLTDFELIRTSEGLLTAAFSRQLHEQSRRFLEAELAQDFAGPTVVITHHAPHPRSIHPRFAGDPINACFVSDLADLMGTAALWIHGHVHNSFDYEVDGTRIIANPRGYPLNLQSAPGPTGIRWENTEFDARLIVRV